MDCFLFPQEYIQFRSIVCSEGGSTMDFEINELQTQILDNMPYGVYCLDPTRTIKYWNKGAEIISGYSSDEMIGRHCYENWLDHIDNQGVHLCKTMCPMTATMFDGKHRKAKVWLKAKNGARIPVLVQTAPLYQENKIVGAIEYFYQIEDL